MRLSVQSSGPERVGRLWPRSRWREFAVFPLRAPHDHEMAETVDILAEHHEVSGQLGERYRPMASALNSLNS